MAITLPADRPAIDIESAKRLQGVSAARLDSIDLVRGLVMVLMALDHVRDYFTNARFDPINPAETTPAYFLTRWVTHFCAPTFIFLAGTGAFLAGSRGKTTKQLSWFLLTRGLWLAVLEVTVVHVSWTFNWWDWHERNSLVIWAIGWSMIGLAGLVYLPTAAVAAIGLAIITFHDLFDAVSIEQLGPLGWLWALLHQPSGIAVWHHDWTSLSWVNLTPTTQLSAPPDFTFGTPYPILPWLGVMAAGYGLGAIFLLDRPQRRKQLLGLGIVLTLLFVGLRVTNRFGDSHLYVEPAERPLTLWPGFELSAEQSKPVLQVMAFLDCSKYPPSLLFLLMTLGPAITALALFDRPIGRLGRPFVVFGRVPLFYYLLHLPLIHGLAVAVDYWRFGWSPLLQKNFFQLRPETLPPGYGLDLPMVYLVWVAMLLCLYPLCYGFMLLKRRYPGGVLSYF